MSKKKASPATKAFIKFPLKTLTVAGGLSFVLGGEILGGVLRIPNLGKPAHEYGMKWIDERFRDIDRTFGE